MAAEAVPAPGAGRFRAGGAPADLLGGELCKVTEGETLDAPDGASATNSPEELLAAADSAATLPALAPPRSSKAASTTPEVVGVMEVGDAASTTAASGAVPDGLKASVADTDAGVSRLGLCVLGMEVASAINGGEGATGGEAAPSAAMEDGPTDAAAACSLRRRRPRLGC